MMADTVLLDIATCRMTLGEVLAYIEEAKAALPTAEIFLDGDRYALVARMEV